MDKVFICVLAIFTIALRIIETEGAGPGQGLSLGIAVRQGEAASVITQKNGELLLNCSVDYDTELGPLSIRWTQDGEPVDLSSKRIQQLGNGSLYVRRVIHRPRKARSDGGTYRCLASLAKVGTIVAREVLVQVAGIDRKFEIEPSPQLVPLGGVARFQCKIKAVPPAMYLWERNGTMLPQNNNRYLILSSGILQITGVNEWDVGRYKCYVTQGSLHRLPGNDIDTKYSSEATLDIDPHSTSNQVKIVASSKNETALVGSQALLECLVQGNVEVEWKKNGQALELHGGLERIGDNLQFLEADLSDSGQYQCVAGNVMVTMSLNVIQKPVIREVTPESQAYLKSVWIYLTCDVSGTPKPHITWLKDGIPITDKDNRKYKFKDDQLTIVFSELSNSGYYQCVATNTAGSTMGYTRLKVYSRGDEPEKPTNVTAINVTKNEIKIVWNAAVSADSQIVAYTVHYRKAGDDESLNEVTPMTQYLLEELSPFSEYSIEVAAFNKNGQGPVSNSLVVRTLEDVPLRPPTITVMPGTTFLNVSWVPMPARDRRGNVASYKLYFRRKGEKQARELTVPGTALWYKVQGLEPKTEYQVRLNAGTSAGFNTFSDAVWPWVDVRTNDEMYIQLDVESINSTAVNVTWVCERDAAWSQITLEARHLPSDTVVASETLTPDVRHHVITKLAENTIYEVTLDVKRSDGRTGQVVEEFRTSNVPLPPAPRSVHHTVVTATSIGVGWVQADSKMEISRFTVRYSRFGVGGDRDGVMTTESNTNRALLEGLLPFTQYRIAVQSHSGHVTSKFSSPLIVRTKEGVPSEPQNIQIETLKPGHINVEWSPPAMPNGHIRSYIIMYASSLTDDDDKWFKIRKNGTELSAVITITKTDGQLGVLYFKLLASTTEGPGRPSPPVSIDMDKVPAPIIDEGPTGEEQRTGIIIGISIGGFCIVICICIICCRHRILSSSYNHQPQTQPARFHGNGHLPGSHGNNGHAVGVVEYPQGVGTVGSYEMEAYRPMLEHLPENEDSDSKGGGGGNVILTPNGTKLNGFVPMKKNGIRNGAIQNGHMTPFISSEYNGEKMGPEETRGLIASMLNGGGDHCLTSHIGGSHGDDSDGFPVMTATRHEDLGSLDDIDHSSCEDVLGQYRGRGDSQGHGADLSAPDSGYDGNGNGSVDVGDLNSIPQSDMAETADTVVCVTSATSECRRESRHSRGNISPSPLEEEGRDSPLVVVSGIEIPQSASCSSSSCEDTCHDGGTSRAPGVGPHLPQIQQTTSTHSQAPWRPDRGAHTASSSHSSSSSSSSSTPPASPGAGPPVTEGNGTPPTAGGNRPVVMEPGTDRHSSSNGFAPQLCGSPTQGEVKVTSAQHNPTVPRPPLAGETTLSHGAREATLDKTLAQVPQDAAQAATVNSSSWKHHYQV